MSHRMKYIDLRTVLGAVITLLIAVLAWIGQGIAHNLNEVKNDVNALNVKVGRVETVLGVHGMMPSAPLARQPHWHVQPQAQPAPKQPVAKNP